MTVFNEVSLQFFQHLAVLIGLYLGRMCFTLAGTSIFKDGGEPFSLRELGRGIAKNVIILAGISIVYIAGLTFGADMMVIKLGETTLTVQVALDTVIVAAVGLYGAQFVNRVREFFKVEEIVEEILPAQTTFNLDPSISETGEIVDEEEVG